MRSLAYPYKNIDEAREIQLTLRSAPLSIDNVFWYHEIKRKGKSLVVFKDNIGKEKYTVLRFLSDQVDSILDWNMEEFWFNQNGVNSEDNLPFIPLVSGSNNSNHRESVRVRIKPSGT